MTAAGTGRPSNRVWGVAIAGLMAAAVGIQVVRDRGWEPYQPATPTLWLEAGPFARRLTLGFDELAADVYWMRAVVYYGGTRLAAEADGNYDLLYPLLDLATTLDPRFKVAYRFGAIFLTEAYPHGPGRPDLALDLLTRAREAHPDDWEYMQDIGFIHYWWLHDYRAAAMWFERAADVDGAPPWLRLLAATTLAQGGDRESSRLLWRSLRDGADADWIRSTARLRLAQLDALDQIDQLNALAARFAAAAGHPPRTWAELGGARQGAPVDPAGTPYDLDADTGRIRLSRDSPLFPLPVEPGAAGAAS